ncbi:diguanylate cyclase [Paracoccus sp. JM45]|uniref:diguanylate cyclase n=1 Tax=Paracoccus sp. JM45 TaxID=2283626 RepID=UPI000E6D1EF2|nr:diguanylate cyclase [Paracoccus sp. JM45]RJE81257.1 diguanylate cyclase [Paracoccus sp. JM45]
MTKPVIMIVDDEISNIEMMAAVLEDDYEICFSRSGTEAMQIAHAASPDLILLDIVMPEMDGYELCRQLKLDPILRDVPVIFTTGLDEPEDEVRGFQAGAIDYVTKPIQPIKLRSRVGNHVELKRMRDQLSALATTDALTGLGNRRLLEELLQSQLLRLSRDGEWLSFIMMDIDFFKQFNDIYGHLEGDNCLRLVALTLRGAMRRNDDACLRYGGEEFACILPRTDHDGALEVAEDIRRQIEDLGIPHSGSGVSPVVTISIGVATGRSAPDLSMELWISTADAMLYQGKRTGRNQVTGHVIELPKATVEIEQTREAG